ncbi:MAG: cysteine--tRNA ligase [Deferribacterota bacterium]|nr:cysteine--tRNA ligase [Deferribacterota bacterium]
MIKLYNTLTEKKEEFIPINPNEVKMYVCGVTVYDYCHIGHARSAVIFDVIRRYFKYKNYKITFVKNFTDIDDKIIKRSKELNIPWHKLAAKFIEEHNRDMDELNVERPDIAPKATEYIDDMINICRILLEKGFAYEVDGNIYFRVKKFKEYGKLSHRKLKDMLAGARIEVDERKEFALDFALWKKSKEDEPSFPSPWGDGRPGWHIECTAMGAKLLGLPFDIHGGGKDLIFPHHENEIAQTEASFDKPLANYWLHNGFVNINKEKMSKSLGNFFLIRDITKEFSPEVLRLYLISSHYRKPLDFTFEYLLNYEKIVERFYLLLRKIEDFKPSKKASQDNVSLNEIFLDFNKDFDNAMDDDFNTPIALVATNELIKNINKLTDQKLNPQTFSSLKEKFYDAVKKINNILGIFYKQPEEWFDENLSIDKERLYKLINERNEARKQKNYALADKIRDELLNYGINLHDTPDGTKYTSRKIHKFIEK